MLLTLLLCKFLNEQSDHKVFRPISYKQLRRFVVMNV